MRKQKQSWVQIDTKLGPVDLWQWDQNDTCIVQYQLESEISNRIKDLIMVSSFKLLNRQLFPEPRPLRIYYFSTNGPRVGTPYNGLYGKASPE